MNMDWFSWLSKTGLEPSLVYEYGLAFAHNELEDGDIVYFNHEFLQSMGISIAKHRLEILKFARKEKSGPRPMARVVVAIKRCVSEYIRRWVHHHREGKEAESALVLVPRPAGFGACRWRGAMLKRNKKLMMAKQDTRLLLTNSSTPPTPMISAAKTLMNLNNSYYYSSPPVIYDLNREREEKEVGLGDDEGYWTAGVEEIRWDTMFHNLKPT